MNIFYNPTFSASIAAQLCALISKTISYFSGIWNTFLSLEQCFQLSLSDEIECNFSDISAIDDFFNNIVHPYQAKNSQVGTTGVNPPL